MEKITKVGLLCLMVVVHAGLIVGGFFAYEEMSGRLWKVSIAYKQLVEQSEGIIIDYGVVPNPFAPLLPLALLSMFATIVLLVNEIRTKY